MQVTGVQALAPLKPHKEDPSHRGYKLTHQQASTTHSEYKFSSSNIYQNHKLFYFYHYDKHLKVKHAFSHIKLTS